MKNVLVVPSFIMIVTLLIGCTNDKQSFEQFFNEKMKGESSPHKLIHNELDIVKQGDAMAIYQFEDKVWVSYYKTEDDKWILQQSNGVNCNSPVDWTSNNGHIFSGMICDDAISEVHVDNQKAEIITVEDKKFWYVITSQHRDREEVEVKYTRKDGSEYNCMKRTDEKT